MRAQSEVRDPVGLAIALATLATLLLLQEGPLVAVAAALAVLGVRVLAGVLLSRRAATTPTVPGSWYAPLTRREAEIAELVAGGLTNREIADRLVLSERTIDNHVFHVMNKLNVHHRTEIGVWVVERRMKQVVPRT
jgi:DNA-binding NarL/FixJ family response regulator